jgi:hypothetical protein
VSHETADLPWVTTGMRIRPAATTIALVALLAGLVVAGGFPSRADAKTKPCWERVIDDWLDNGTIDKHYKPACLQQALKHVPEDLRDYSNLPDAISAALQDALRGNKPGGGGGSGNGSAGPGGPAGDDRRLQGVPNRSYYRRAIDNLGTTSADSLPIPLLVLAGVGTALLLSAGGLVAAKRIRAHRGRGTPPAT